MTVQMQFVGIAGVLNLQEFLSSFFGAIVCVASVGVKGVDIMLSTLEMKILYKQ